MDMTQLSQELQTSLLPFQWEGVRFGSQRKGVVMIGDEMGLGKTIQAITLGTNQPSMYDCVI